MRNLLATSLLLAGSVTAQAQVGGNITAADPNVIAGMLQDFGLRAEMATDEYGDPQIKSATGGINFQVWFYDCTDHVNCQSLQFRAGLDLTNGTTYEAINAWNDSNRYSRATVTSEMDPYLKMDLNLINDGIGRENFRSMLDLWDVLLGSFAKEMGF
jgi:hypothetical protein